MSVTIESVRRRISEAHQKAERLKQARQETCRDYDIRIATQLELAAAFERLLEESNDDTDTTPADASYKVDGSTVRLLAKLQRGAVVETDAVADVIEQGYARPAVMKGLRRMVERKHVDRKDGRLELTSDGLKAWKASPHYKE